VPETKPRPRTRVARIEAERNPLRRLWKMLGPGFVTGASDDDPSGIGTYAVAGASLGMSMLWTALATLPLMAAVQNICARIALVSGTGLAGVIRETYPRWLLYPAVFLLFTANTINVGADLGAIADAIGLLVGTKVVWAVIPIAVAIVALQVFGAYRLVANVLKVLALALLAYVIDAIIVRPDLGETLRATFLPAISFDAEHLELFVAILGTTISPYLFFWQTDEEIEEEKAEGQRRRSQRRGATRKEIAYATADVNVGMTFSNLVFYFIVLATATTLFANGKHDIRSAADAAEALRPLAGDLSGIIFALGLIGTGLLAIPVLAGSAAFALSEAFGWRAGLDRGPREAKAFYGVLAGSVLVGAAINFVGINPIDALVGSAVLNGIVAPPLLVVIMLAARSRKVMGAQRIGPVLSGLGWLTALVMFAALVGLAYTTLAG
jgi:NRAMP (natural resistance-associated macrophage protein)-like metal ion transporter